jgi:4-hydroxy-tetrahydrodipicolinate synthase
MDCSGLGVAVVTPFKEDGSLDEPALRKVAQHLIQHGVDYIVALGTTGEAVTQTPEERIRFLEVLFGEVGRAVPIVIGAGGYDTHAIAEEMRFYGRHFPAAAFLSVTPYYNKPRAEGLLAHYRYLAEHSPLPIILYNVPVRTGVNLPASITIQLAQAYPGQIIALKDASLDLIQGMEILFGVPSGFQMVSGDDALAYPAILMGYVGVISVLGNALPALMKKLIQAAQTGQREEGRTLQAQLLPLMRLLFAEGNPTGIKGLLSLMGLCGPYTRLPLLPASPSLLRQLEAALLSLPLAS